MRIITAPEPLDIKDDEIAVFLAGGITDCPDWQKEVIGAFNMVMKSYPKLVLLNPRRANFPIDDPNAAMEQITWEFNALERTDIFSMYFCSGISDQPICMYELGRNIVRMQMRFPADWEKRIIITQEQGYRRFADVRIQTVLATEGLIEPVNVSPSSGCATHSLNIRNAYKKVKRRQRGTN